MRKIDKFVKWCDKWLPYLWGFTLAATLTCGLVGLLILVVKWVLTLVGVM